MKSKARPTSPIHSFSCVFVLFGLPTLRFVDKKYFVAKRRVLSMQYKLQDKKSEEKKRFHIEKTIAIIVLCIQMRQYIQQSTRG